IRVGCELRIFCDPFQEVLHEQHVVALIGRGAQRTDGRRDVVVPAFQEAIGNVVIDECHGRVARGTRGRLIRAEVLWYISRHSNTGRGRVVSAPRQPSLSYFPRPYGGPSRPPPPVPAPARGAPCPAR